MEQVAIEAVTNHKDSHVEMAMAFASKACPEFLAVGNDRLLKAGRSLESLVSLKEKGTIESLEESLKPLIEECKLLASGDVKVPKRRFGKTELQMPIVTLGCMRFQHKWGDSIQRMNQVPTDCQDNLVRILKRAICEFGINHIETARAYGCSELQLGVALKQLFDTGVVKREDLIIQTKVPAHATADAFKKTLDKSLGLLKLDYVDLFAFHGCNMPHQYGWIFGEGKNIEVVKEYVAAGKIRHVGFSTHGPQDLIRKFIETDAFEYANIHYHYFGSYTTTGVGPTQGNLGNLRLLNEKDMGVFIISPYDKGGKLYEPSNKLRSLTLPDMEPMDFGSSWLWCHKEFDSAADTHTIVCGAARPSDLDQPAVAAYLLGSQPDRVLGKVKSVLARLEKANAEAHDADWLESCYEGVPKSNTSKYAVEHNQIVWCYNVIKSYGLLAFAKDRYGSLESNRSKWDDSVSHEENHKKIGLGSWGFVPGLSIEAGKDYSDDFAEVPEKNKQKLKQAEEFVHKLCVKKLAKKKDGEKKEEEEPAPFEWQAAYEMKPWADWPDRP